MQKGHTGMLPLPRSQFSPGDNQCYPFLFLSREVMCIQPNIYTQQLCSSSPFLACCSLLCIFLLSMYLRDGSASAMSFPACPFYSWMAFMFGCSNNEWQRLFPRSSTATVSSNFWILSLSGERWYLGQVLIYISFMSGVEKLFIRLRAICISFSVN